jgi:hypothetical protein
MENAYLIDIINAIEKRAKDQADYAVHQREDEIRQILGLKVMHLNITTDWEIYKNEEVWCSPNYGLSKDFHIDTLLEGKKHGDMIFLPRFLPIESLLP